MRLSDHLLDVAKWPKDVLESSHFGILSEIAQFSLDLVEEVGHGGSYASGDLKTDESLHRLFGELARLATWLPKPSKGRSPHYTRTTWDLRSLARMIPEGMSLKMEADGQANDAGFTRWNASLHDYENGNKAAHPSFLEHNAALSYDGGEYSEAWTPNLALARILLAAYLLAAIQTVQSLAAPKESQAQLGLRPSALTYSDVRE